MTRHSSIKLFFAAFGLLVIAAAVWAGAGWNIWALAPDTAQPVAEPPVDPVEKLGGTVRPGDTMDEVLAALDIAPAQSSEILRVASRAYNIHQLRAGNHVEVEREADGPIRSFRYQIDLERDLYVEQSGGQWSSVVRRRQIRKVVEQIAGVIENSLYLTLSELGEEDALAVELAEIFRWDIDFHSDIQAGDSFKVLVEKHYAGTKLIRYGTIYGAEFRNGRRRLEAIRFEDPTGHADYYSAEGKSLRKAFLRSPFRFNPRISSRFTHARFHPILKRSRPHLGVDYAAPTGTPVLASADGIVRFSGYKGGYGRFVELSHAGQLVTTYAHLSSFATGIGQGRRVKQGQVIGRVGSTGLATGPHLDYRVIKAGRFVDPLKLQQVPNSEPVKPAYRAAFAQLRHRLQAQLAAIQIPPAQRSTATAGM